MENVSTLLLAAGALIAITWLISTTNLNSPKSKQVPETKSPEPTTSIMSEVGSQPYTLRKVVETHTPSTLFDGEYQEGEEYDLGQRPTYYLVEGPGIKETKFSSRKKAFDFAASLNQAHSLGAVSKDYPLSFVALN